MSKRISFILDDIRHSIQKAIDINKDEAVLLEKLSKTDDQDERESLIFLIDVINADTFDYLDRIDSYVIDLEEALGGDSDEN